MKIVDRTNPGYKMNLSRAIEDKLEQADYYAGLMEKVESKINNTAEMLSKIIEMLHTNGALTKENVETLLPCGYKIIE